MANGWVRVQARYGILFEFQHIKCVKIMIGIEDETEVEGDDSGDEFV
jgi:hypothetical protein